MNRAAKICIVTLIGRLWDAVLVTDDGFGAFMCKKCTQSHRFGLGRVGEWGGIPLGGEGGSYNPCTSAWRLHPTQPSWVHISAYGLRDNVCELQAAVSLYLSYTCNQLLTFMETFRP